MTAETGQRAATQADDLAVVYGLARCDTTKKALSWLVRFGIAHRFVDYREQPVPPATLREWAAAVGWDGLINRQSKTWRELLPARKNPGSEPEYLLLIKEHPTLVKRPVLEIAGRPTFGFSDRLYKSLFDLERRG
jgi:Spx/MgsR family transcriptional regulator